MNIPLDISSHGFSAVIAKACAAYAVEAYTATPDVSGHNDSRAIIRDCGNCIVLAFQGTHTALEFLTDAEVWEDRIGTSCIHAGFYAAWLSMMAGIIAKLNALEWSAEKPLIICGHSLGGAEGMIAAFFLGQTSPVGWIHSVYTFGQPRCGDKRFAKIYNAIPMPGGLTLKDCTWRFVNGPDIVPWTPGVLIGYRHAGQCVFFSAWGPTIFNAKLSAWLLSGTRSAFQVYSTRRDVLIANHFMASYMPRVEALT